MKRRSIFLSLFIVLISLFIFGCTLPGGSQSKEDIEKEVNKAFADFDKLNHSFTKNSSTSTDVTNITLLSVNDFHGALEETEGEFGAARMGGFIIDQYNNNPNGTVILAAGDMFQGTGVSNYRHGRDVIHFMNAIGFDAMIVGNHEFDWGLNEVLKFIDGVKENGEANFPFLGCNIVYKGTEKLVDNIKPYTIIEKGGVKIGIIGFMGFGLEYSIATSMIADYEFLNPIPLVAQYAEQLRVNDKCDLVIAVGHDDNDSCNSSLAMLSGNQRIDGIFNGHNHLQKTEWLDGTDGRSVPVLQGGSSGEAVSEISFELKNGVWTCTKGYYHKMNNAEKNSEIESFINKLTEITAPLFQRVLTYAGKEIRRYPAMDWCVDALRNYSKVEVAFINSGGIRNAGFPISKGEAVTVASVYKIMPFDNTVKTCELNGNVLRNLILNGSLVYSTNVTVAGSEIKIDGKPIISSQMYKVAAVDYVFDKTNYPFVKGQNIEFTGKLFRDVLIEALEEIGPKGEWTVD